MKDKKSVAVVIAFLLTVIAMLSFVGCRQEDPKYDVAIKVANNYGMEWVFEPGVDELYYEFEYTGEDMTFGISEYYVYGHPNYGDMWLSNDGASLNWFHVRLGYRSTEGETPHVDSVVEKGYYCYTARADGNSSWNYRVVRLYITVK